MDEKLPKGETLGEFEVRTNFSLTNITGSLLKTCDGNEK